MLIGTVSAEPPTTTRTSDEAVIVPTTLDGVEGLFFDLETARDNLADLEHYDWLRAVYIPNLENEASLAYDIAADATRTATAAIEALERRDGSLAIWRTGTYVGFSLAAVTTALLLLMN